MAITAIIRPLILLLERSGATLLLVNEPMDNRDLGFASALGFSYSSGAGSPAWRPRGIARPLGSSHSSSRPSAVRPR